MNIRDREQTDLPVLATILMAQREVTGYPVSLPDSGPLGLIQREHEVGAWVATDDRDRVVGHVAVSQFGDDLTASEQEEADSYLAAHGVSDIPELGIISTLFISHEHTGKRIGETLLQFATNQCRQRKLKPCLDVVIGNGKVMRLYERLGWQVADEITPDWLPKGAGAVVTMTLPR